jgi:hypothetical protein
MVELDESKFKYDECTELLKLRVVITIQYENYRYVGYYNPILDYNARCKKN